MAESHPEVAVGIDRHAIGRTCVAVLAGVDGDGGVADCAAGVVVIIGADLFGHRVDVIQLRGVGAPADAVGVGDLVDFEVQRAVGIEHVERGIADVFDEADRARPKAARGVALAVVEAIGRTFFGFRIGEVLLGSADRIEGDDSRIACIECAAALTWHDGADEFADVPRLLCAGFWIESDERVAFDIYVDELIIPPDWAFAPFGNACADGLDGKC